MRQRGKSIREERTDKHERRTGAYEGEICYIASQSINPVTSFNRADDL